MPRSRDRRPDRSLIDRTARALAAAGFTVHTDLDDELRSTAEVEADLTRQQDRADRLAQRAVRAQEVADHADTRAVAAAAAHGARRNPETVANRITDLVARQHPTTQARVRTWLQTAGVSVQPRTSRAHRKQLDPDRLRELYVTREWSAGLTRPS